MSVSLQLHQWHRRGIYRLLTLHFFLTADISELSNIQDAPAFPAFCREVGDISKPATSKPMLTANRTAKRPTPPRPKTPILLRAGASICFTVRKAVIPAQKRGASLEHILMIKFIGALHVLKAEWDALISPKAAHLRCALKMLHLLQHIR